MFNHLGDGKLISNQLYINWRDITTNNVLKSDNITNIEAMLLRIQLSWAGHIVRLEDLPPKDHTFYKTVQYQVYQKKHTKTFKIRVMNYTWIKTERVAKDSNEWHQISKALFPSQEKR